MSERPKVQHSKCCVVSKPPWVQIPPLPPNELSPTVFFGGAQLIYLAPRDLGGARPARDGSHRYRVSGTGGVVVQDIGIVCRKT